MNDSESTNSMALRHTFVSMLFALVIAEIAVNISRLASIATSEFDQSGGQLAALDLFSRNDWLLAVPASHLLLALILICSSWVGWSRSIDGSQDIQSIFSIPFVQLLIELGLVVLYFVLVTSVEIQSVGELPAVVGPSAVPEAFWLMIVYAGYFVWDIFADALLRYFPKNQRPFKKMPKVSATVTFASAILTRAWVSGSCFVATWVVFNLARTTPSTSMSSIRLDAALACIVLWFWLAKAMEPFVIRIVAPWESTNELGRKPTLSRSWVTFLVIMPIVYLVLVIS